MYTVFEWLHLNKPNQTKQTILRQTYAQMIIWNEAYSFYLELVEREREKKQQRKQRRANEFKQNHAMAKTILSKN